jgi:hypothetical protein|tara:strand:- start:1223 stop:1987 length:765 start_codon:yes stop_codon:yes gene_type:complete
MKNIFFLCSLPRAGNTLLGSIINNNDNIKCSPNSINADILNTLISLKENIIFKNFPNHNSFDNVVKNIFKNYYQDWKADTVIDRSSWGTPDNLKYLKDIYDKPKFIILFRPVLECLSSFLNLEIKYNNLDKKNIEEYVYRLMDRQTGIIGKSLWSIENLIKTKQNYKIFYYKDLVNKTDFFLNELTNYLNIEIKQPKKLKQFCINNIYYNDKSLYNFGLHDIDTSSIKNKKHDIDVAKYIPDDIIKKYRKYNII